MSTEPRILVVEDDEDMREILVDTLEDEGYHVSAAASSVEALARAERVVFDLVVTDVRMAGRDGLETLAELRRLNPKVKSIVITGYASDDAPTRAIREQASDYLYKPFNRDDLILSVRCVLLAREEKGRLQTLLEGVLAGAQRVVAAAGTALASRSLASVDEVRECAFTSFYVGVRSRKLTPASAFAVWQQLEALELERERLKNGVQDRQPPESRGPGPSDSARAGPPAPARNLEDGFQYVTDLLAAFARDQVATLPTRGAPNLTRETFASFFRGIVEGRILPHQLTLAPFLRTLDWHTVSTSPELQQLYRAMWGDPAA